MAPDDCHCSLIVHPNIPHQMIFKILYPFRDLKAFMLSLLNFFSALCMRLVQVHVCEYRNE